MAKPTVLFPVVDGMKICTLCRTPKDTRLFNKNSKAKTGLQARCKACCKRYKSARNRGRRPGYHDKYHAWHLRRDFNITKERYLEILRAQGGRCAICRTDNQSAGQICEWSVDHDHACCPSKKSCGKCVRGLLCRACNVGIGSLRDDPALLEAALRYLIGHGAPLIGDARATLVLKVA